MDYEIIDKKNWSRFFNQLTRACDGHKVQLELVGSEIGDQIEKDWTLINGFSYDTKSDSVFVHAQDLEHEISHPEKVTAQKNGGTSAVVIESDGMLQILHFQEPISVKEY